MNDKDTKPASKPQTDAKGSFAKGKTNSGNDGVSSANPRVISGKKDGDATFTKKGLPRKR
ncbi:hypothetical protein [Phyllobacterium sp. SB3]|uniref:hypothetical protein n=1 Tax=Phyllobacterium sp. SB3 TaxID=3156073 RepID=UPI0032AF0955